MGVLVGAAAASLQTRGGIVGNEGHDLRITAEILGF